MGGLTYDDLPDCCCAAGEENARLRSVNRELLKALCKLLVETGKQDDTRPTERSAIACSENVLPQHVTKEFIEAIARRN